MTFIDRVFPGFSTGRAGVGLLVLRATIGTALMHHGWTKIQNPFHWMDRAPSPAPALLQSLAALSEFGGGFALIIGLVTPLAALGVMCTMGVAMSRHIGHGDPFVGHGTSWELPAAYFTSMFALIALGPGALSLDRVVFGSKKIPTAG